MNKKNKIYRSKKGFMGGAATCFLFIILWFLWKYNIIEIVGAETLYFTIFILYFISPVFIYFVFQYLRKDPIIIFKNDTIEIKSIAIGLHKCILPKRSIIKCETNYKGFNTESSCSLIFYLKLELLTQEQIKMIKKVGRLKKNLLYYNFVGSEEIPFTTLKKINESISLP